MTKKFSPRMVLPALLATGVALAATPASAGAGAAGNSKVIAFTGHGTVAPGWSTVPSFQTSETWTTDTVDYAGQVNGAGANCQFNGASTNAATVQQEQGSGSIACSGGTPENLSLTGTLTYTRTGPILSYAGSGTLTVNGRSEACTVTGAALMEPTSLPTVTSYRIEGIFVLSCS